MSLPKQVQAQLEEVERYDQALLEQEGVTQTPEGEQEQVQEQPEVLPEPAPVAEPEASKPEVQSQSEETWQSRYKTLKGMFDAEVPRLNSEVKGLKGQLNAALAKIEALEARKAKPEPVEPLVTDKDVEAFGGDLIDVIDRKAREVARSMVNDELAEVKAENQRLLAELNGVSERQVTNDRRAFFAELGSIVPDYEAINVDDGFLGWLSEVDPLSGMPRQEYLNDAYQSFDVRRTAALFNTYKQLTAPPVPTPTKPVSKLERQVAPGTSKVSENTPTNTNSKIWTAGEVEHFYRQVAQGKFKGNEVEQVRIEAEIDLAVAEGRYRG